MRRSVGVKSYSKLYLTLYLLRFKFRVVVSNKLMLLLILHLFLFGFYTKHEGKLSCIFQTAAGCYPVEANTIIKPE